MLRLSFDFTPLIAGLRREERELVPRLIAHLAPVVEEMVAEAKREHPWENQTGDAESGLFGDVDELTDGIVWLFVEHGPDVDYGWYLETRFGGRWGVIRPTFDAYLPRIRQALVGLL